MPRYQQGVIAARNGDGVTVRYDDRRRTARVTLDESADLSVGARVHLEVGTATSSLSTTLAMSSGIARRTGLRAGRNTPSPFSAVGPRDRRLPPHPLRRRTQASEAVDRRNHSDHCVMRVARNRSRRTRRRSRRRCLLPEPRRARLCSVANPKPTADAIRLTFAYSSNLEDMMATLLPALQRAARRGGRQTRPCQRSRARARATSRRRSWTVSSVRTPGRQRRRSGAASSTT
jgi:hypothetical protein